MTDGFSYSNGTCDYVSLPPQIGQILAQFCDYLNYFFVIVEDYLVNTVEHLILGALFYLALCVILYLCITQWGLFGFTRDMRNAKRVLFVTAHPDDEVMFFGPTIFHYTQKPNCMVFLMCLSSGKNYGMDKVRTNELYQSCKILGIKEENIFVHNNSNLPDTMDVRWPLEVIAKHVLYVVEAFNITNVVTFDRNGVSGHQNHCSIYYAVANLILDEELPKRVIGAIDGTNVQFKAPLENQDSYIDKNENHSIKLQVICTHNRIFTNIVVGFPGSVHDARVFRNSELYLEIAERGFLRKYFPQENYHLVGDKAYPLLEWLIKPYLGDNHNLTRQQRAFNFAHSKTRIIVEHSIGLLKGRWRILKYINVNSELKAIKIIAGCCVLHNFCYLNGDEWETDDELQPIGLGYHEVNHDVDNMGSIKRNRIAELF